MKYHLIIWTDDGFKREFEVHGPVESIPQFLDIAMKTGHLQVRDSEGQEWFFNWNHVLGGTIREIEEKA